VVISKRVEILTDGEILLLEDIQTHKRFSVTATKEVKDLHKLLYLMEKLIKLRSEAETWMQETENYKSNLELVKKELEQLKASKRDLEKDLQITKQKLEEYQHLFQKEPQLHDPQHTSPPCPQQLTQETQKPVELIQNISPPPLKTQPETRWLSSKKQPEIAKSSKKNSPRKSLATSLQEMEITYTQFSLYEEKNDNGVVVNEQSKHLDALDVTHREPKFKVYSQRIKSTYLKKQKQQIFNHTEFPHQPQLHFSNNTTPIKTFPSNGTPGKSTASISTSTVRSSPTTPSKSLTESEKKKQRIVKSLHLQAKIMDAQNGKKKLHIQKLKNHPKNTSENDINDD